MENWIWLIPTAPLVGFLINGFLGRHLAARAIHTVACGWPLISLILTVFAFTEVRERGVLGGRFFTWIHSGALTVAFGLQLDRLSTIMALVVTGVGFLIHIYSIGYMRGDKGYARYFAYLNLFMFSMLILVMADSLPLMFVGWEGVGLCSYLLIGFWFDDLAKADAGKKAFITNRIGDAGFILGMLFLYAQCGTLRLGDLDRVLPSLAFSATVPALLFFLGACGKSAQIPLYVWLPDAMAGPTPVSALIHAATMVTAGVYMIARLHVLYEMAPFALEVIGVVAAATAFLAAVIAAAQRDIKKILAYSTISQLGFMFCGMAAQAFHAGIFHLVTHAFFKALLFLGAGAVIHALAGQQDIFEMGGLRRSLKFVFVTMLIGVLAISGLPGFSGFFSKDEILGAVYAQREVMPWTLVWYLLVMTTVCTAFYMVRLLIVAFFGAPRHEQAHLHPPGGTMRVALAILAVLSVVGGVLGSGIEAWVGRGSALERFDLHVAHGWIMGISVLCFIVGGGTAVLFYGSTRETPANLLEKWAPFRILHGLASRNFFVDEIYEYAIVQPLKAGATVLWFIADKWIIDTLVVNGSARTVSVVGGLLRRTQTGVVNAGVAAIGMGAVAMLGYVVYRWIYG